MTAWRKFQPFSFVRKNLKLFNKSRLDVKNELNDHLWICFRVLKFQVEVFWYFKCTECLHNKAYRAMDSGGGVEILKWNEIFRNTVFVNWATRIHCRYIGLILNIIWEKLQSYFSWQQKSFLPDKHSSNTCLTLAVTTDPRKQFVQQSKVLTLCTKGVFVTLHVLRRLRTLIVVSNIQMKQKSKYSRAFKSWNHLSLYRCTA